MKTIILNSRNKILLFIQCCRLSVSILQLIYIEFISLIFSSFNDYHACSHFQFSFFNFTEKHKEEILLSIFEDFSRCDIYVIIIL